MVNSNQCIQLFGKPVFSWVTRDEPRANAIQLPSDACFAYILDGERQRVSEYPRVDIEAGQVILSLCGYTVSHMLSQHEPGNLSTIVVHFDREVLKQLYAHETPPFWQELESPVVQYITQMSANALIKMYFDGIAHLFQNQESITEALLVLKLKEIIVLLLQTQESPQMVKIMRSLFSERTFSFKEVIEAHICEPITVEQMATLTNHSLSSFKREFKKVFEATPAEYIMDRRTEKVADRLGMSDESISQIGYDCGFTSPAHLSRAFKAKYGMSPSQYRLNLSVK